MRGRITRLSPLQVNLVSSHCPSSRTSFGGFQRRYDRIRMSGPRQDGFDLRPFVRQAWRRKWLLLAIVVVIPVAAYLLTAREPKVYQASTLLKVAPQNINISNQITFGSSGATETGTIIRTTAVARVAAQKLG